MPVNAPSVSSAAIEDPRLDGRPVKRICLLSHDGRPLELSDLTWIDSRGEKAPLKVAAA